MERRRWHPPDDNDHDVVKQVPVVVRAPPPSAFVAAPPAMMRRSDNNFPPPPNTRSTSSIILSSSSAAYYSNNASSFDSSSSSSSLAAHHQHPHSQSHEAQHPQQGEYATAAATTKGVRSRASSSSAYPNPSFSYSSYSATNPSSSEFVSPATTTTTSSGGRGQPYYFPAAAAAGSSNITAKAAMTTANEIKTCDGYIALLLLPPLTLLLVCNMSTTAPLLATCCAILIIYSLDLVALGYNAHGYYTLLATWSSFVILSILVGYDILYLSSNSSSPSSSSSSSYSNASSSSSSSSISIETIKVWTTLLSQISVSTMLLLQLVIWITIQLFQRLMMMRQMINISIVLERILYITVPPISATSLSYAYIIYYNNNSGSHHSNNNNQDYVAIAVPYIFAFVLTCGIRLVGTSPSRYHDIMLATNNNNTGIIEDDGRKYSSTTTKTTSTYHHCCAISPTMGKFLSYLLVYAPSLIHVSIFHKRYYYYSSYDDLFDIVILFTASYTLHYLLLHAKITTTTPPGSSRSEDTHIMDERWRMSLPWVLRTTTSTVLPSIIMFMGCIAFQQRYLVPLCAKLSYLFNGHDRIVSSPMYASIFLSFGTVLAYISFWFLGRKDARGASLLLHEYHEDCFQLLLALSVMCYGLSCGTRWTFLPVPILLAESVALWILTKQLRYAALTAFVVITMATIIITYRLTFLTESVEVLPGRSIVLKKFADLAAIAATWLVLLVGLILRAPGGYASNIMRKLDFTGICLFMYALAVVVMEFALLLEPMPLYSRDNNEVGRVAVYSPGICYITGILSLVITWHVRTQKVVGEGSAIFTTSIIVGKILAVIIESSLGDYYDSLGMIYRRWLAASLFHILLRAPFALQPIYMKSSAMVYSRKRGDPSAKPTSLQLRLPTHARYWAAIFYCAVVLPSVIVAAVRLVIEPLIGLFTGQDTYSSPSPLTEVIAYSASIWGVSVLIMINHFFPNGGADAWRKVSALTFVIGLFISFVSPTLPGGTSSSSSELSDLGYAFQPLSSSLDVDDNSATGGWGLVSAFLAILLAMLGPLELREVKDASGRRDTRQLLRLMIFGLMFGCGLSFHYVMQSMSKDIFIPIFVTTFSCMAVSTLGTVAIVMAYFLEAREFGEAEQIANGWACVCFPVFFIISSMSLSAHAHAFGIGGWASTYLSVCGLFAGAFSLVVGMRKDKTPTTRGYGNAGCVLSWLCAIIVVYGRYGVAGVGVVGTTSVAGIPVSVITPLFWRAAYESESDSYFLTCYHRHQCGVHFCARPFFFSLKEKEAPEAKGQITK